MMFDWYELFNYSEFLDTELTSRTLIVILNGIGQKEILVVRGNEVSIVYEDVILPVDFKGDNPFIMEGSASSYAIFKHESGMIWLGIEHEA